MAWAGGHCRSVATLCAACDGWAVRSGSAASGRMRLAMGLTIVGAVMLITGLLMVFVSEVLRLKSDHIGPGLLRTGELLAAGGLGIGVVLLGALTIGRADRGRADRGRADRGRADRRGPGRRRRAAGARTGPRREPAGEWRSPLPTAGAGLLPQRVLPSWQEPVDEGPPGSDDYADEGWQPYLDDGWNPGPVQARSPGGEDDWDRGGDADWRPGGEDDWDRAGPTGVTAWLSDDLGRRDGNGHEPSPATGPRHRYKSGPRHRYLNAPGPGYLTGPQPAYAAGPEPEQMSGQAPPYASDPDAEHVAGPEAGYLAAAAGPAPGRAASPRFASAAGTAYPEAAGSEASELDGPREDDDTSPIPVIRGTDRLASAPRPSEPVPAPKPFSVWEPAPKPSPERGRGSPSDEVYRPVHAEPPSSDTQEKIEQIKDLYLTAEAIGEEAVGKHFEQLRQRQQSLIREFFDKAGLGSKGTPEPLGDDPAQSGASLPG